MTVLEFILPALVVILLSLPLIKVFTGKVSVKSAKIRLATHVAGFAGAVCLALYLAAVTNGVYAEETAVITGTIAQGLGFVAAALATGLSALGAGIAVAAAAPAAIGATSEDPKAFGKAIVFVGLAEGVSIFGLLIAIFIKFI